MYNMASLLLASLLPALLKLETGGKVKKTQMAMVHKNEYMLPASVKPTPAQVKKVNALKKKKAVKKTPVKKAPKGKKKKGKK